MVKKIDYEEYENRIRNYENQLKQQNPNANLDQATQAQIRDQVWDQMIMEELVKEIENKLGIKVTDAELKDLLYGANPHPMVRQAFTNPQDGSFDPQMVMQQLTQLEKSTDPNMKQQVQMFKDQILQTRLAEKFNALISGAVYTPKFMLDAQAEERDNQATIDYVSVPLTTIPDANVKVSDDDINNFMKKHEKQFTVKEKTRSIDYVTFNVTPSATDSARVVNGLNALKESFASATDEQTFINRNSENQTPVMYMTADEIGRFPNAADINAAGTGTVVGPFFQGENALLAKVVEKSSFPDSVRVRHILVATKQNGQNALTDEAAKARIDSAVALYKGGMPFDSLVTKFSDDGGSKTTKGEYTFHLNQKANISKEFGDFSFSGAGAGADKIVKVENPSYSGYHYIQIIEKGAPTTATKIALINKQLAPEKTTYENIYAQASQFANKVSSGSANFDKEALAAGVAKLQATGINENSFVINGLGGSQELVSWIYKNKVGDVSPIMDLGGNKYVVAKITEENQPGLMKVNTMIRPGIESYIRNQKKSQMIIDKNKNQKSLDAVAAANQLTIATAENVNFTNPSIPNLGYEPKVVGNVFAKTTKPNVMSQGIPGNTGVTYFVVKAVNKVASPRDLKQERMMNDANLKNSASQIIMQSLKNNSKVEDKRAKLYNR